MAFFFFLTKDSVTVSERSPVQDNWSHTHIPTCLSHSGFWCGQEQFWKLGGQLSSRACSKALTHSSGPEQCNKGSKERGLLGDARVSRLFSPSFILLTWWQWCTCRSLGATNSDCSLACVPSASESQSYSWAMLTQPQKSPLGVCPGSESFLLSSTLLSDVTASVFGGKRRELRRSNSLPP